MKVLVVRFSSIGDIILTTPVVRALKTQIPGCEVHYITRKGFHSLLVNNPYIDRIITIDKHVSEVAKLIKEERYDHVIDLHHNLRSFQVKIAADSKCHTFPKLNIEKWLLVNFKRNLMPDMHIVDRYFRAASPVGVRNDGKGLDFFFSSEKTEQLPAPFDKDYIALVIGAKFNTKRYPNEKVRALCQSLSRPVVLIGGPEDISAGEMICAGLTNVYNACGLYSFEGSAHLLKRAAVVVANDTGFMHIAAALKKPVVSLWGNTVPEFGMTPYLPATFSRIIERKDVPCRPCSKIGYATCPKGHFNCMNLIETSTIIAAVNELEEVKQEA